MVINFNDFKGVSVRLITLHEKSEVKSQKTHNVGLIKY